MANPINENPKINNQRRFFCWSIIGFLFWDIDSANLAASLIVIRLLTVVK